MVSWLSLVVPFASALVAVVLALAGNYWLQNRLGRRIRDADEVRARLYDFLSLVAEYWTAERRDPVLEARVLATKLIVVAELGGMRGHSRRLRQWYRDTEDCRLDMIAAATGGCFQQENWVADPRRVLMVARDMGRILRDLRRAC